MDQGSGNTLAAAPFDLDSDSNRLPSTIANLVNFVFVYINLALNFVARFISVTFYSGAVDQSGGIYNSYSTGCQGFMAT